MIMPKVSVLETNVKISNKKVWNQVGQNALKTQCWALTRQHKILTQIKIDLLAVFVWGDKNCAKV